MIKRLLKAHIELCRGTCSVTAKLSVASGKLHHNLTVHNSCMYSNHSRSWERALQRYYLCIMNTWCGNRATCSNAIASSSTQSWGRRDTPWPRINRVPLVLGQGVSRLPQKEKSDTALVSLLLARSCMAVDSYRHTTQSCCSRMCAAFALAQPLAYCSQQVTHPTASVNKHLLLRRGWHTSNRTCAVDHQERSTHGCVYSQTGSHTCI